MSAPNVGPVCGCGECITAGVAAEPQVRVPDGCGATRLIHGRELRRWLNARHDSIRRIREHLATSGAVRTGAAA